MMNGYEKSDPSIVAEKPANKAEWPSAARAVGEPYAAETVPSCSHSKLTPYVSTNLATR
jgi:hypothetical protein